MCELRSHLHTSVETRQHWTLLVQRLRAVSQDERAEQAAHQTQTQAGESHQCLMRGTGLMREHARVCVCV